MLRRSQFRAAVAVCALILLSACSVNAVRTGSDFDQDLTFSEYRKFAWIVDRPAMVAPTSDPISLLTVHRIQTSIEETLIERGYELVGDPNDADFVVSFVVGTRDKLRRTTYPVTFRGPWDWCGPHCYEQHVLTETYTEGTLSVDIFDVASEAPAWHGWAQKTVTISDRENPRPIIKRAVEQLLQNFPPSRPS